MNYGIVDFVFTSAGIMMFSHILLSLLLRYQVGWHSELASELFLVPNSAIVPDWGFRLLNAKYFLPWVKSPEDIRQESFLVRLTLFLARLTGLSVPILLLAFMVLAVILGNVYGFG